MSVEKQVLNKWEQKSSQLDFSVKLANQEVELERRTVDISLKDDIIPKVPSRRAENPA